MTSPAHRELEPESPPVVESMQGHVLRLTLTRPARRNSLSLEMMAAIGDALDRAERDSTVRAVVIAAEGPVFSAGHDLKELTSHRADDDRGRAFYLKTMENCSQLMLSIARHPKPVIAEIAGVATAAGCQLVATCDLAIASEEARFQTPGVHIGLFCSTPMVAVSRSVERKHAYEMLLTGDAIPAERAAEIGLINRVVKADDLSDETMALAEKIATKSSLTLKTGKEAFQRQLDLPLEEAYDYCAQVMVENMLAEDAKEGIGAFLEKRSPSWTDR